MEELAKKLDDQKQIEELDPEGMLKAIEAFPAQCEEACEIVKKASFDVPFSEMRAIAILGMGGSGISGDIVRIQCEEQMKIPIFVSKGYFLPSCIDKPTLCFAVSYSGNTEETLTAFDQAVQHGCPVISITSGGVLEKKTRELNLPLIKIPSGFQPRAALGYLSLPILGVVCLSGLAPHFKEDVYQMIELLKKKSQEWGRGKLFKHNQAKQIAAQLYGTLPVIYGSDGPTAVAALRWKTQFNENSKSPAFWNIFPELNHNETVGWQQLKDITTKFSLILLRDEKEDRQIAKRFEVTKSLIKDYFGQVIEVWSEGVSRVERTFSTIYLGDFVSVYLAFLYGVNPSPVERVEELKRRLAED